MKKHLKRISEIKKELREKAALARSEKRDFTEAENQELADLKRELSWLENELKGMEIEREETPSKNPSIREYIRQICDGGKPVELVIRAEAATTDNTHMTTDLGALQPTEIGEIIDKVEEELIWTKLGIKMPTGLGGQYEWPVVGDFEAEFAGEGVEATTQKLDISKVPAVQQRAVVSAALTRESIFNSKGLLEEQVRSKMPKAIARAINNVVLSPTKKAGQNLSGPFVTATAKSVAFNFKGLNSAKAALLAKGYSNEYLCWVMSEATKAELEATPKDTGSGIMVIENGLLCGRPVYTCSAIGDKIGLGDFRFQVIGQFGQPSFITDPYSKSKAGKVEMTLNANFGSATLVADAFMILTKTA